MKERLTHSTDLPGAFWITRLLLILVISGGVAHADLKWEKLVFESSAPVGRDAFKTAFRFSNGTNGPVRIIRLESSCGCTTAALKKDVYAAGEKGEIEVEFDGKGLSGLQEKTVKVFTDASAKPTTLTMRITIPAWIEISPRLLWWSVGEEAVAKEAVIVVNKSAKIQVSLLSSDDPAMKISLAEDPEENRYRLRAQPVSTKSPMQATVTLVAETPGASPRRYSVFAHVR